MKRLIPIAIFVLPLLFTGCSDNREDFYIFNSKDFFSVYKDKGETFSLVKSFFMRNSYKTNQVKLSKFSTFPAEISKITAKKNRGTIFMENFLYSSSFNLKQNFTNKKYKLITYNIEELNDSEKVASTINFYPDSKILADRIISILKKRSKTKNLSDCAIIISNQFQICNNLEKYIKSKYGGIVFNNNSSNSVIVKDWMLKNKNLYKAIALFGFDLNAAIKELDFDAFKDNVLIEVLTDYGAVYKTIDYSINLDYVKLVQHGLHSKKTKKYLSKVNSDNKIENLLISNRNIVKEKKYSYKYKNKILLTVKSIFEKFKKKSK
ncbi:MAG TPA: hypothetical protein PK385_00885 [Spirochaetota bacterium]|nr:hypothetical protein [Spirochaetota bacterium]HOS32131.1 hypothetical protein [Spirochaetota bacterium]HOS54593.1 hypothetical protein [Spirochaetota bacterium]HPK60906.1 hypothetical protein [Spirochaetota bacterium]HQF77091.1 hypothetical protein [Spirochaetota bacterium]